MLRLLPTLLIRAGTILLGFLIGEIAFAAPPWATDNLEELHGSTYRVVCVGDGPALDVAREEALSGCRASASRHLDQTFEVHSVSIETESETALHQEIKTHARVKNLKCMPEKEEVEETDDHYKVFLKCRFDLAAAKVDTSGQSNSQENDTQDGIRNRDELRSVTKGEAETPAKFKHSARFTLSIASVPFCKDLLVEGGRPRRIECSQNPMPVTLGPEDHALLVRALGYQPKKVELTGRRPASDEVTVILDRN